MEEKLKKQEERFTKGKKGKHWKLKLIEIENGKIKKKLQNLEDRSRCDKLHFDGINFWWQSWSNTMEKFTVFFNKQLNLQRIKIKRVCETTKRNVRCSQTIMAKFSSYKAKERVRSKFSFWKGTECIINEGFWKETLAIRKENWK